MSGDGPAEEAEAQEGFGTFAARATGFAPYPYQQAVADNGYPELLRAPTGSGKTVAAVLPWLWRRRFHPDVSVRGATPRWLVIAQPFRTLVEQVEGEVRKWLGRLGLTEDVGLHVLMGGRGEQKDWTKTPGRDAIIIGSVDMLLSRAMNRGYAANRYHWPIDFGMYNSDAHWVFDEVQLLGPALPTSRQLQAFRDQFGTIRPTSSTWMSATVEKSWLSTIDAPDLALVQELEDADGEDSNLKTRLQAARRVRELTDVDPSNSTQVADAIKDRHRVGTRTIVVVNTVARARDLYRALAKGSTEADPAVTLVHSRFRPADRARAVDAALDQILPTAGRIVVTTQALEAGVDITSTTLVTEAAPWTSIVQRAGRCNRDGKAVDAHLWWMPPASSPPYDDADIDATVTTLRKLEGRDVTGRDLAGARQEPAGNHPVLRRRDLLDLFDTAPSLGGEDIDIGPYIREGDDRDVFVFWRSFAGPPQSDVRGDLSELCRVSIADARKWVDKAAVKAGVWRFDPEVVEWQKVQKNTLRPGMTLLAESGVGGYSPVEGWNPASSADVPTIQATPPGATQATDDGVGEDALSLARGWVRLPVHLLDAAKETADLLAKVAADLPPRLAEAAVEAAALHDLGKCHPAFQNFLHRSAGTDEVMVDDELWAKSSQRRQVHHQPPRRHHRHELVSLLQLSTPEGRELIQADYDLVRYLVAAHHGKVRLGIRPLTADQPVAGALMALGVVDGDLTPPVVLADGKTCEALTLSLRPLVELGPDNWGHTVQGLLDRPDLGPFRLAWLEAVVRLGDWAASASPSEIVDLADDRGVS